MALIKMRLDGIDMMVPEEDCVWTKKNGELHHIHTLGEGFCLFEFEGLEGTFEERFQQVKDNRTAALEDFPTITNDPDESENNLEKMPIIDHGEPEAEPLEDFPVIKPKKKSTSDWLFDN